MNKLTNIHINASQLVLIVLTVLFALLIGASFFLVASWYAPLIILVGIIAIAALFTWVKKPVWALYFTLFVVLLPINLIPPQINSYINRVSTVVALLVWLFDIIRRRGRIQITTSTLFMFIFIAWAVITLFWAEYVNAGTNVIQQYVLRLMLFLVLIVNEITSKKDLEGLMNTLALSGILLVVVSLVTILLYGYSSGTRLRVLGMNENSFGVSLLITMPGVLFWALRSTKQKRAVRKWLAAIFIIASIGLIGLSGSRGSTISMGIALLAFLIWKPTRLWGILGIIIIGVTILVAPIVFSTTIARFLGETRESLLGGREILWPVGWQLIKDHLVMGVGIGNSPLKVIPYFANAGIFSVDWVSSDAVSLHNPIMVIWAETGLTGLMLYLSVFASAVISFVRQYVRSWRIGDLYLIPYYPLVASVFLGYMVSWIKTGGMESDFSYFLIIGLLLIPNNLNKTKIS